MPDLTAAPARPRPDVHPVTDPRTVVEQSDAVRPAPGLRWDLDVLRVLAILGVVSIHIFGLILARDDLRGTATWHFGVILNIATRWCVPLFVMISGALILTPRAHAAGPGAFLRRRVVRLLPALVVWHLVYLLFVRSFLRGEDLSPTVVAVNLIDARVYTALYFLWLILGLYAVAPLLAAFLAAGGHRRAVVTAIAAMAWSVVVYALPGITALLGLPRPSGVGALTMWLAYVGLFVAGYAWRVARPNSRRYLWTGPLAIVLLVEIVWQFNAGPEVRWLQALAPVGYTGLGVVLASLCIFVFGIDVLSKLRPSERVRRATRSLAEATFGVFLCHLLVVALIRLWWPDWYADPAPVAKTQLYIVVLAVSFGVSLLARRVPVLRRVF